jgi:coenzyme F420-0:L-glutamate ligase / coenzyme F420-1:gamma-L-glutamate ligase
MERQPVLGPSERAFVEARRTATLATSAPSGQPRLVPVCFVLGATDDSLGRPRLYTPLDEKPKQTPNPRDLARVRDLLGNPNVTVLVDCWDEDWSRLGWIRLYGRGELLAPETAERHEVEEHARAVTALRAKYPQYGDHALDARPIIRIVVDRVRSWGNLGS